MLQHHQAVAARICRLPFTEKQFYHLTTYNFSVPSTVSGFNPQLGPPSHKTRIGVKNNIFEERKSLKASEH